MFGSKLRGVKWSSRKGQISTTSRYAVTQTTFLLRTSIGSEFSVVKAYVGTRPSAIGSYIQSDFHLPLCCIIYYYLYASDHSFYSWNNFANSVAAIHSAFGCLLM